ncbi:MAG: hypothetical protein LKJ90_06290 [Faecalibacterium sp.]|jgi:hypothetical protein|nr:hypothetical protein [Faecalibacterium sp.]
MKKFVVSLVTFCMLVFCPLTCFAASADTVCSPQQEITYTQKLPDNVVVVTTITYEDAVNSRAAASTRSGHKTNNYYHSGEYVGTVTIYGTFAYTGSAAWATNVSGGHSTAAGWAYGGEKTSSSGAAVYLHASFSKNGLTCPVDLALTCSANGTLS